MVYKLFVDDTRPCPAGFECARDFDGAILLCRCFDFDFMDLDYSLGAGGNGLDLLRWLCENGKTPAHINIHSSNVRGRARMAEYAHTHLPGTEITLHPL